MFQSPIRNYVSFEGVLNIRETIKKISARYYFQIDERLLGEITAYYS